MLKPTVWHREAFNQPKSTPHDQPPSQDPANNNVMDIVPDRWEDGKQK